MRILEWRSIDNITDTFLLNIMQTNLFSAFWGCKAAVSPPSCNGCIINISSMAGKRGSSNNSAYVASKFALNGLTQSLCKELDHVVFVLMEFVLFLFLHLV